MIDVSSRRAAEESAWRIKSVKLERDRHAQQRHLNPLNMADTIGKLVDSFKGRHRDAILVIGEVGLLLLILTSPPDHRDLVLAPDQLINLWHTCTSAHVQQGRGHATRTTASYSSYLPCNFCLCCFECGEMVSQDTLEVFVESPEAAAPTKKLRKGLSKVFGRKDSDSDGEADCMDAASGVGEAEEALEGHLFSVGVAFAQVSSPCTAAWPVVQQLAVI